MVRFDFHLGFDHTNANWHHSKFKQKSELPYLFEHDSNVVSSVQIDTIQNLNKSELPYLFEHNSNVVPSVQISSSYYRIVALV